MNMYSSTTLNSAIGLGLLLLGVSSAQAAGQFRTYISSTGLDTNSCSLQSPCRLLPAALAVTAPGGEVWMLDSANYNTGAVTITQSVTILAVPGVVGSVVANGANAIVIPTANLTVTLRNLVVREIDGTANRFGVDANGANTQLVVEGSEFSDLYEGVFVFATGNPNTTITHSVFRGNNYAIDVETHGDGLAHGTVDHCLVTNAGTAGVYGLSSRIVVSNSTIANGSIGIDSDTGATILLENDVIENNTTGVVVAGDGLVETNGNNTFAFNGSDGVALLPASHK